MYGRLSSDKPTAVRKMADEHSSRAGFLAVTVLATTYGLTAVMARYLSTDAGVFEQWYLRYGIAFILSVIIFHRQVDYQKFARLPAREWAVVLFRTIVGSVAAVSIYTLAADDTKIALVAFMQILPSTALLGVLLFHEQVSRPRLVLIGLSFLGATLVCVNSFHDLGRVDLGAILSVISGFLFALQFVTRRWHRDILNDQELTLLITGLAFLLNFGLAVLVYRQPLRGASHWDRNYFLILIFAGGMRLIMDFLINFGFQRVSAVFASNILSLEQVFATLAGYVFYTELPTWREVVGGLTILAAVIATNQLHNREQRALAIEDLVPAPD
jgi:drug/metabolite transporter (DMT)-like permease